MYTSDKYEVIDMNVFVNGTKDPNGTIVNGTKDLDLLLRKYGDPGSSVVNIFFRRPCA